MQVISVLVAGKSISNKADTLNAWFDIALTLERSSSGSTTRTESGLKYSIFLLSLFNSVWILSSNALSIFHDNGLSWCNFIR